MKWFDPERKPSWANNIPPAEQNKWIFRAIIVIIVLTIIYLFKFYFKS